MKKRNSFKSLIRENPLKIIVRMFGYDLINKKSKPHYELMPHLLTLINHLKINCFIDVGANNGNFGLDLREVGYEGLIVSFEPVSSTYKELLDVSDDDPLWRTYNLALGSANEKMEINLLKDSDLNSLLPPNDYFQKIFKEQSIIATEMIDVRTFDSMIDEITKGIAEPRIFLKMDTQGYDHEVLKGASGCINKIQGISSELSFSPLYQGMMGYVDALEFYSSYGFKVTGIYPVSRDLDNLSLIEADCFMVRTKKKS